MIDLAIEQGSYLGDITEKSIQDTEDTFGRKMPKLLLEFFSKYNGTIPVHNKIYIDGEPAYIERFLAIKETDGFGEYDEYNMCAFINESGSCYITDYDKADEEGFDFVPFAILSDEDTICLDFTQTPQSPSVVRWSSTNSDILKPVTTPVASSLDDFLNLLHHAENDG